MLNFAPRSTVPVLMLNGRNDFSVPLETNVKPMFNLQGAPDEHKRLVILEGGHVPDSPNVIIREVLEANSWNRHATAEALGINRTTLYKKMKRLGLDEPQLAISR